MSVSTNPPRRRRPLPDDPPVAELTEQQQQTLTQVRRRFDREHVPFDERLAEEPYVRYLYVAFDNRSVPPQEYVNHLDKYFKRRQDDKPLPPPDDEDDYTAPGTGDLLQAPRRRRGKQRKSSQEPERKLAPGSYMLGLLPNPATEKQFESFGNALAVDGYNDALKYSKSVYDRTKFFAEMMPMYRHVKSRLRCDVPKDALMRTVRAAHQAIYWYDAKRKSQERMPFPALRQRLKSRRYFCVNYIRLDRVNNRVRIPKIGWVDCIGLNAVPKNVRVISGTVRQYGFQWNIVLKTAKVH